ncbi:MAG: sigma-54 dependent transcriptional regulator [Myxococcota bacterium]
MNHVNADRSHEPIEPRELEVSLSSPLRLRLVAELLERSELALEQAVLLSGRHLDDISACLAPMTRWGVVEFITAKRFKLAESIPEPLLGVLQRVVAQRSKQIARERRVQQHVLAGIVGLDARMIVVFEMIRQIARLNVPVLISGETGTGKEMVARAVHELSPRGESLFGAVNCAAISEALFASEMFGHVRGAFTGAVRDTVGLVEQCRDGSLFLDEIGDLDLANQVKLLRVLQEGTFTRVGETRPKRSNFRLLSATHRDLPRAIDEGRFREDLYYRLNVFPIRLPSLRERLGDLPYLVEEILTRRAPQTPNGSTPTITPEALEHLRLHRWPGNIRELQNVLMRAAILAADTPIAVHHLPIWESGAGHVRQQDARPMDPTTTADPPNQTLEAIERQHIARVLRAHQGNVSAAARVLGISRTTLYARLKRHGMMLERTVHMERATLPRASS